MAGDDARAGECGSARWESAANVIILDKMSPTRARAPLESRNRRSPRRAATRVAPS
jgi:hypothetical protein|tara:strand:- start:518 stop:685 length:168 start_codon:yes stop_codon:yes gene_type:complete